MENQIEIFVIVSSAFLGIFILLTVYLIIKLKINDMLLQKSEKQLQSMTDSLQQLVESQTEDIRKSERRFRELYEFNKEVLENSPAGIIKFDINWEMEFCNLEAQDFLQYQPQKINSLLDFKSENETNFAEKVKQMENGQSIKTELTLKMKKGVRHFELKGVPLNDNKMFNGAVLLINDTTETINAKKNLRKSFVMLQKATEDIIMAMANTSEMRDPYTAGHQKRVQDLALAIACELGVNSEQMEGIRFAGIIHDIGKIAVPSDILAKPGNISKMEYEVIKSHSLVGYELLKKIEFPWPIAEIVYQHHEKIDGSGYPRGLSGDNILLEAQILAVADVMEAMVSHRPYRAALGLEKSLRIMNEMRGTSLNPKIVDACINLVKNKGYNFVSAS